MSIHAQSATFKGVRFRSRLEARWAMFFDRLRVPYQYEPRSFQFGDVWYLPDFYLPKQQLWVEIKGQTPTDLEFRKAGLVAAETSEPTLLFAGKAWKSTPGYLFVPSTEEQNAAYSAPVYQQHYVFGDIYIGHSHIHWCLCPRCEALSLYLRLQRKWVCFACDVSESADDSLFDNQTFTDAFNLAYSAELWKSWYR